MILIPASLQTSIDNMKYCDIKTEAFNTQIDWVMGHENPSLKVYAAKLPDDTYLELAYQSHDDWNTVETSFSRDNSSGRTGTGNQMQIFGAVINHIINFIQTNQITKLVFSAHKPQGSFGARDSSRSDLYKKMATKYIKNTGYELDIRDVGNNDIFTIQDPSKKLNQDSVKDKYI